MNRPPLDDEIVTTLITSTYNNYNKTYNKTELKQHKI